MVIAITVLSLLLACMAVVFAFGLKVIRRMSDEIKYQEDIIDAKNDTLRYYLEDHQEMLDAYEEIINELAALKSSMQKKKPVGRPKGSKNKVQKPKFDKVKFNDKYGK
jgi:hypothetical protein